MFKFAHEYMVVMPNKYHDTKKILELLNDKIDDINDVEIIKVAYEKAMELIGIEPATQADISVDTKNSFEALMHKTIASIKKDNNSTAEVVANIDFETYHPVVDDMTIAYLLGILLENAIQTMTHKPIYISIMSSEYFVAVKVSNEAKYQEQKRLEMMFNQGASTKAQIGRGFGLFKLKQTVKKYKGKVSVSQAQNMKEKTNYLSIFIRF